MSSRWIRGWAVAVALSVLSGCAFTQMTDQGFFGSPEDPPSHADREWAGVVILPFAMVGDIISSPVQLLVLLITGDYGIYRGLPERAAIAPNRYASRLDGHDGGLAVPDQAAREELLSSVATRLSAQPTRSTSLTVWGIDAGHNVMEIPLTSQQQAKLVWRLQSGSFDAVALALAGIDGGQGVAAN